MLQGKMYYPLVWSSFILTETYKYWYIRFEGGLVFWEFLKLRSLAWIIIITIM